MLLLQLPCIVHRFGMILNSLSIFLFPIGIGLIIGFDTSTFYFFIFLATITVILENVNLIKQEKDLKKVPVYVGLFKCFSLLVIIFFVMVEIIYPNNIVLKTTIYTLFLARGIIGLFIVTKWKTNWRIFNIVFNILWLLFGMLMFYSLYIKQH